MFLALDPGETTGWAFLGPEGFPKNLDPYTESLGQVRGHAPLRRLLRGIQTPPRVVIFETYRIRGHYKNHFGSEVPTIQNIGIIKSYYYDLVDMGFECELVEQEPSVKKMGYGWGGLPQQSNHNTSHQWDAMAHAVYYVCRNKIRPILRLKG